MRKVPEETDVFAGVVKVLAFVWMPRNFGWRYEEFGVIEIVFIMI
jgi:hypothetical protein